MPAWIEQIQPRAISLIIIIPFPGRQYAPNLKVERLTLKKDSGNI